MVRSSKKQVNDRRPAPYLPWLTDELKQEVRKHFEPKYERKLTDDEVFEFALTIATEKPSIDGIAAWFKSRSRKLTSKKR